ncbi:hypothetical protein [Myroides odoratus]|uniref:hypothetical protein n=1 Tax=Myroides odoratus TaxID=256 RepID=UPI0033405243
MAKHIIKENIKTIGGQSIVGKGDIEAVSTVQVDGTTIALNSKGEVQLGIGEKGQIERDYLKLKGESLTITNDEGGHTFFSSDSISIHSPEGRIDLTPVSIEFIQNMESTSSYLAIGLDHISSSMEDGGAVLRFPRSEERIESTLVVSVNNMSADEKGNITLTSRDTEFEKFLCSFPTQGSVYKYDREKMGNTFGDLFLPVANFFDYYPFEITIFFIDENGEQIAQMDLPESIEAKYSSILPPEVDGQSFYIVGPS